MAWYLAPSLSVLRTEVNTRWPNRDKASDGTIGDDAHQNRPSDHNPNSRDSVDAWDMDKDGVNVDEVIAAFQRHASANYWIWNRQIADKDTGWRRVAYDGSNPHTMHVHFSIRQTAAAEQNRDPWGLLEDDMAITDAQVTEIISRLRYIDGRVEALWSGSSTIKPVFPGGGTEMWTVTFLKSLAVMISNVDEATAAQLKARFDTLETKLLAIDALLRDHASGQLSAEEVVRRMGELLSA